MSDAPRVPTHLALDAIRARLGESEPDYAEPLTIADATIGLYAPRGEDLQQPHDRDEFYVVVSGSGRFRRGAELVPFGTGDLLFVGAGEPHWFEAFTDDFLTWVIFVGAPRG